MFQVGEQIGFLHERGTGIIQRIDGKKCLVLDEDGFERWLLASELIRLHEATVKIKKIPQKDSVPKKVKKVESVKHKGLKLWEVDLHIEELVDEMRGMSSTEMLLKQLSVFKNKFNSAKNERVDILVVIHGVGEGVLKNEILMWLSKQEQIEVQSADFQKYGHGATQINFRYNWKK